MTTPKKTLCTLRTFSDKNKAYQLICKLLNTIYEHYIDKQELKGILNIVSGVKFQFFLFVCHYLTYVTNFTAFCMLLNYLDDTLKGILFHFITYLCVKLT